MIRVLSMNFDGTYTIYTMRDMRDADLYANRHVNQLHFIHMPRMNGVLQWVGEHVDSSCWTAPTNPIQAKTAQLLFMVDQ